MPKHLIQSGFLASLPMDLKREILETTAHLYPQIAPRLTVISRDVQHWVEHIIYREIVFNSFQNNGNSKLSPLQRFKRTMETRAANFFAEYVKTLHFDGNHEVEEILPVLEVCTGVTNFGCYSHLSGGSTKQVYHIIHSLSLERLFISQETLNGLLQSEVPATGSLLHKVTRLAVVNGWDFPFRRFPNLTHLAIAPGAKGQFSLHIKHALSLSQVVSVVIMLHYAILPRQTFALQLQELRSINDTRLVNFTLPLSPARFIEDDLWDLAMEFPDEEQPVAYLEAAPYPRILTFAELTALDL